MPSRNVLLTGAGFTANWGGFLNTEMWSHIFNNKIVQTNRKVRALLLDNFKFERVLDIVRDSGSYSDSDRETIWAAVNTAFEKLESNTAKEASEPRNKAQLAGQFIEDIFSKERGFFFTLNQDLFVERHLFSSRNLRPGINPVHSYPNPGAGLGQWRFAVPTNEDISTNGDAYLSQVTTDRIRYVKLHGSIDWRSEQGSHVWVIGGGKMEAIEKEPILRFYFRTFEKTLSAAKSLLVIGYGFNDDHINGVLLHAINECKLRVIVISPQEPNRFQEELKPQWKDIWKGLGGYYPYKLIDVLKNIRLMGDIVLSLRFGS